MRYLDTDALATLVAIHDLGSFTAAAQHLCKTQAGVSATIKRFEKKLGRTLIDRAQRGIVLTPAGETLLGYARSIRKLENEALLALRAEETITRVRVGMPDDYLEYFGTPLIRTFSRQSALPRVEIVCDFSTTLEKLVQEGTLDIAIVTRDTNHTNGEFLFRESRRWCSASEGRPELEQILPLALFPEGCRTRPLILRELEASQLRWHVVHVSTHLSGVLSAVRLGGALTALPASAIPADFRILGSADGLPTLADVNMALLVGNPGCRDIQQVSEFIRAQVPSNHVL
jgi:DNA-binding transcriptional LysR family regulator